MMKINLCPRTCDIGDSIYHCSGSMRNFLFNHTVQWRQCIRETKLIRNLIIKIKLMWSETREPLKMYALLATFFSNLIFLFKSSEICPILTQNYDDRRVLGSIPPKVVKKFNSLGEPCTFYISDIYIIFCKLQQPPPQLVISKLTSNTLYWRFIAVHCRSWRKWCFASSSACCSPHEWLPSRLQRPLPWSILAVY
jgi:hypothetical protein